MRVFAGGGKALAMRPPLAQSTFSFFSSAGEPGACARSTSIATSGVPSPHVLRRRRRRARPSARARERLGAREVERGEVRVGADRHGLVGTSTHERVSPVRTTEDRAEIGVRAVRGYHRSPSSIDLLDDGIAARCAAVPAGVVLRVATVLDRDERPFPRTEAASGNRRAPCSSRRCAMWRRTSRRRSPRAPRRRLSASAVRETPASRPRLAWRPACPPRPSAKDSPQ